MGLKRGASDFLALPSYKRTVFIELKIDYKTQSEPQKDFEKMVDDLGHEYYLIKNSIIDFQNLIKTLFI
jgi:DNA-directed RNA polymerase subunit N (RpoN/RPB10)